MTFEIEKGIPLPIRTGPGGKCKYPWREMGVGDSFVVRCKEHGAIRAAASYAGKRLGVKFATRKIEGGVRVWRVE